MAEIADLKEIYSIYEYARGFMKQTGNPNQWAEKYPPKELLSEDIENKRLYVIEREGRICGVFYFYIGTDKTYLEIEGEWGSGLPYGTIHRIAAAQNARGIFSEALKFTLQKINHIRIDTHADNKVMQSVLDKHGFSYRGIIYVADGTPRRAYELIRL